MLGSSKTNALYPLLQYYTGSEILDVFFDDDRAFFKTKFGENGELFESDSGDWRVLVAGEEIALIEKIVFQTLIIPDRRSTVTEYVKKLDDLLSESLRYRSRILISQTLKVLEGYIINSDFIPEKSIKVGSFCVFGHKKIKFVYCLN